jgi:PIN domain nuclease of toxin-antitoxin system
MGHAALIVIDTHVLLWWLAQPDKLSATARALLARTSVHAPALVSAISVLEIVTAARRGRLALSMPVEPWLAEVRRLRDIRMEPITDPIAERAGLYGDDLHGDPADRLIAATASVLGLRLISADDKLRSHPQVQAIW